MSVLLLTCNWFALVVNLVLLAFWMRLAGTPHFRMIVDAAPNDPRIPTTIYFGVTCLGLLAGVMPS